MDCVGTIEVKCKNCETINHVPCNDFNGWEEVSQDEGAAGREIQNESTIEVGCKGCDKILEITASVWTYPDAPSHQPDCFDIDSSTEYEIMSQNCNCSN